MINIGQIDQLSADFGLIVRGGFSVTREDGIEDIETSVAAGTLILFGNAGSSLWHCFSSSKEYADGAPDPLNRWSERVGNIIAEILAGRALFPFSGPPYQPFLKWARKAESLQDSRLGMLIHPQYGLWHAYRFAIALPGSVVGLERLHDATDMCARCINQPCLSACPVNAFSGTDYDVERCFKFLNAHPKSSCRTHTCKARLACPEGIGFQYQTGHASFHMTAFFDNIKPQYE